MESLQPLATESFSYSWLTNKGPACDDRLNYEATEDQEAKYLVFDSKRFTSFKFEVLVSKSLIPTDLVDADEIFFNGQIIPLNSSVTASLPVNSLGDGGSTSWKTDKKRFSRLLGKWRKLPRKLLQKCFKFLGARKSIRVAADMDRKDDQVVSIHSDHSDGFMRDSDNSISEAVLHCKRSISM